MFIELHESDDHTLYVEFYLWTPCYPLKHHKLAPIHHDCTAKRVYMKSCDKQCTYQQFQSIINSKIQATGTYIDLCTPYNTPIDRTNTNITQSNQQQYTVLHSTHHTSHQHKHTPIWPWLIGVSAAVLALGVAIYLYRQFIARNEYNSLDEYPAVES